MACSSASVRWGRRPRRRLQSASHILPLALVAAFLGSAAASGAFLAVGRPAAAPQRQEEPRYGAAAAAAAIAAAAAQAPALGAGSDQASLLPPPPWAVLPEPVQVGLAVALLALAIAVVPTFYGMGYFGMPLESEEDVAAYEKAEAARAAKREALAKAEAKRPRKAGVTFGDFENFSAEELTVGQRVMVRDANEDWTPGTVKSLSPEVRVLADTSQIAFVYRYVKPLPATAKGQTK